MGFNSGFKGLIFITLTQDELLVRTQDIFFNIIHSVHYNSMSVFLTNKCTQLSLDSAVIFSKVLNCCMFPSLLFHRKGVESS